MKSFNLSREDMRAMDQFKLENAIMKYFVENYTKFSVGDILIKKSIKFENNGEVLSNTDYYANSHVPIRYVVVHIDEVSKMPYIKEYDEAGKLHETPFPVFDFGSYRWGRYDRFELDPNMADAAIFGEEYDLGAIFKEEGERKSQILKKRKEQSFKFLSLKEINSFLLSRMRSGKPTCKITFHPDTRENYLRSYSLNEIVKLTYKRSLKMFKLTEIGKSIIYHKVSNGENDIKLDDSKVLYLMTNSSQRITSIDLLGQAIYDTEPVSCMDSNV